MEFVIEEGKQLCKDCSTLILPALSIGNVGQLAVDLLVSSTKAERIGYLDDPYVLPCVGNDAYAPIPSGDLCLPLEVYDSQANYLTFVQQRSPIVKVCIVHAGKRNNLYLHGKRSHRISTSKLLLTMFCCLNESLPWIN